jgi:hypothetical protein
MTSILKNIAKIFEPDYNNLDGQLWVQKLILKKYLKENQDCIVTSLQRHFK